MSDNIAHHFIDTNILVYAHDTAAGDKHRIAIDLLKNLWETEQGCLSIQVLQEFYVSITRKVTNPISSTDAQSNYPQFSCLAYSQPNSR